MGAWEASEVATTGVRDRVLAGWLLGTAGAVFGMVVVGGVTRLTRSGLSMVDWRPQGSRLPSTTEEWEREFDKYKSFPEYQAVNQSMELDEFKFIYFMEWAHRMWGRGLGVVFGAPLLYFAATGRLSPARQPGLAPKLVGLLALGGAQGFVGWWMVKSGLEVQPTRSDGGFAKDPRVSPYRLATHLTMAVTLYSGLVWTGLSVLNPTPLATSSAPEVGKALARIKGTSALAAGLVGVTFLSGCFVAGNDAGLAFNDWPLYAGRVVPEGIWDETLLPAYRNFFENTATVQFDHRMLAYGTLGSVAGVISSARAGGVWGQLPPAVRLGVGALGGVVSAQAILGISTLVMFVPVPLAAMHQAGALSLWTSAVYLQHALRYARP